MSMRIIAILVVLAGAACFNPTFRDPACGPGGECPAGWACVAGLCTQNPPGVDGAGTGTGSGTGTGTCSEWRDILKNGNFEGGHTIWVEGPATEKSICNTIPMPFKEGTWSSCFGQHDNRQQTLAQQVTLPAMTSRLRLRGWRCLVSSETDGTVHDTLTIRVTAVNDDTAVIADLGTWSNKDAGSTCQWFWFDPPPVDASSSPPTATLRFASTLDTAHVTSFYLDVLSLQAFAPGPCTGGSS
jgi:hypothetical protein